MLTTVDYQGLAETLGTAIGYHDLVVQRRLDSGRISRNEATEAIQVLQEFQSFMLGTICQYASMDNERFSSTKFMLALRSQVKAMHSGVVVTAEVT